MIAVRHALLAVGLVSSASCVGINEKDTYDATSPVTRWKVTTAAGVVLTEGCAISRNPAELVKFAAAPGTVVIEQAEWEQASASRLDQPAPQTDEFYCNAKGLRHDPTRARVQCLQTADADPPAVLQNIEPIDPVVQDGGPVLARGYRLTLLIQHPGVLRLTEDPTCAGVSSPPFDELTVLP